MSYYIFNTEQEALDAENLICSNIRNYVITLSPDLVTLNGEIRSRSAKTRELTDAVTSRWAVPRITNDGKWAFPVPTQQEIYPVPLDNVLIDITAIQEPEPVWPPQLYRPIQLEVPVEIPVEEIPVEEVPVEEVPVEEVPIEEVPVEEVPVEEIPNP
jgi:hypothetical protein